MILDFQPVARTHEPCVPTCEGFSYPAMKEYCRGRMHQGASLQSYGQTFSFGRQPETAPFRYNRRLAPSQGEPPNQLLSNQPYISQSFNFVGYQSIFKFGFEIISYFTIYFAVALREAMRRGRIRHPWGEQSSGFEVASSSPLRGCGRRRRRGLRPCGLP